MEPEKARSIKAARQSSANPNIYFPQLILELANPSIYFAQSTLATIRTWRSARSIKAARQSSANPNIYFPQLIIELANPTIYFAQSTLATINPRIQNKSKWRGVWIYLLLGPCLFPAYDQEASWWSARRRSGNRTWRSARSIKAARQSSANPNIYFPQLILELANPTIYFAQSTLATINP